MSRLEAPVSSLYLIGTEREKVLQKMGIHSIGDLLEFYPRRYLDRSHVAKIEDLRLTEHETTVVGTVSHVHKMMSGRGRTWLTVDVMDGTGFLQCLWFQGVAYWSKRLKEGETVAVSGMVTRKDNWQIIHPAVDRLRADGDGELYNTGRIISFYPGSQQMRRAGLESVTIRRVMRAALNAVKDELTEYLPDDALKVAGALPLSQALEELHFPSSRNELFSAWQRVRYEELFFYQLLFAMRRHYNKLRAGSTGFENIGPLTREVLHSLPFELTEGQKQVLSEIRSDLESAVPMQRLLQGEVGSGKTVVALLAAAMTADAGCQTAVMAPTELLATQHVQTLRKLIGPADLKVGILHGKQKLAEKRKLMADVAGGGIDILIGTHALFSEKLTFPALGLVIIDEQHRFGVEQRKALRSKGQNPNLLLMTATPIPRTLHLSSAGDLDLSTLHGFPGGPRQVRTAVRAPADRSKVYDFIIKEARRNSRVFIICPLVEESEKIDTEAAVDYHRRVSSGALKAVSVGLLHGRQKPEEKQAAIEAFRSGKTPVLVATPVVEVGVDMPEATVMLVENPERFGLAALHQLRGRIGRKGQEAWFILMPGAHLTAEAQERIETLLATDDGFEIARRDLAQRGSGEFFGTRQSGEFELRYAHPERDEALLLAAREHAYALINNDPDLKSYPLLRKRFQEKHAHRIGYPAAG